MHLELRRLSLLAALLLAACGSPSESRERPPEEITPTKWLKENAAEVRSISLDDRDFSDLQPLKEAIGDARVVMLGEQSHGDGSTFLAKARLVAFLHQEMGFDVLAWESGFYDVRHAWEQIRAGEDVLAASRRAIFTVWTQSEQALPTFDYVQSTLGTARPLEMAGFDNQLSGPLAWDSVVAHVERFARRIGSDVPDDPEWPAVAATLGDLARGRHFNTTPTAGAQAGVRRLLGELRTGAAARAAADREALWWEQALESIESYGRMLWERPTTNFRPEDNNPRDVQMARNLVWLANVWYPGRKIIVWAASSHIARNTAHLRSQSGSQPYSSGWTVHMGAEAHQALGSDMYAIGFTAATGSKGLYLGPHDDLAAPLPESLESYLAVTGMEYAFVDFRSLAPGGEWLRDVFARPFGYGNMRGDWTSVLDGMFYTREMVPSTQATR